MKRKRSEKTGQDKLLGTPSKYNRKPNSNANRGDHRRRKIPLSREQQQKQQTKTSKPQTRNNKPTVRQGQRWPNKPQRFFWPSLGNTRAVLPTEQVSERKKVYFYIPSHCFNSSSSTKSLCLDLQAQAEIPSTVDPPSPNQDTQPSRRVKCHHSTLFFFLRQLHREVVRSSLIFLIQQLPQGAPLN